MIYECKSFYIYIIMIPFSEKTIFVQDIIIVIFLSI